mmetsp:Transcript_6107/g.18459  ORF Transcript_6107/g.18459 Transcript_6107/m.18459 type:complete len:157 (+) Transcript_6107:2033-2503(+)|eukprot:CAMPEP_0198725038 /NCGR_PEP_ID=MMETSP1475-20131203/2407_1 /TAXON_ID= ORGANISM="Unidentified sp., Strain CCMP1999" /NCGR_SAMPLE_ID=MMETSP1475 /ASSEMBLY_ACC=CAM_ASM_001111 /LENGTH=156 /DNA_ID=CAMNT_0044486705 /DNA_START=117 /DNA_END=587 /DNA_ORIENTATION=-
MTGSEDTYETVLSIFKKYDRNNSRGLDVSELQSLAYDLGYKLSTEDFELAIKVLDRNGTGEIEFEEFYSYWLRSDHFKKIRFERIDQMKTAVAIFRRHDREMKGYIDASQFQALTKELGMSMMSEDRARKAVQELDKNGDGVINFNEYIDWLGWFD